MLAARRHDSGFSLLEVIIAMGITAAALFGLVSVIAFTTRSNMAARENATALRAAEKKIESMRATPFADIFRDYQAKLTFDVPEFGSTAEAARRKIESLKPQAAGVPVGAIKFPVDAGNLLLESLTGALMDNKDATGTIVNIDLDGANGVELAATDKSNVYAVLPVAIEIKWKGILGNRQLTFRHVFLK